MTIYTVYGSFYEFGLFTVKRVIWIATDPIIYLRPGRLPYHTSITAIGAAEDRDFTTVYIEGLLFREVSGLALGRTFLCCHSVGTSITNTQQHIDPIPYLLEVIQQCQIAASPRLSRRSIAVLSSIERCALLVLDIWNTL